MKIMTAGVGKAQVAEAIKPLLGPDDEIVISSDMEAGMALRSGKADFYLGTCHTGAGASLGMLVGLLGSAKCHTFGRSVPTAETVEAAVAGGAVALGFAIDQIDDVVPVIWGVLDTHR